MRIDDELVAFKRDTDAQQAGIKAGRTVIEKWREGAAFQPVFAELARYGAGEELDRLNRLAAITGDFARAQAFVNEALEPMLKVLRARPFTLPDFSHNMSAGFYRIELATHGPACLSLQLYEPLPGQDAPQSVLFTDAERHEIILGGHAEALLLRQQKGEEAQFASESLVLEPGACITTCGLRETRHITKVRGAMVMLQLTRLAKDSQPTRHLRLEDGALLGQASSSRDASEREMAVALLGAMGRRDALDAILETAKKGPDHLRWEAVRQALGLDSAAGFRALDAIARDPRDRLAVQAKELRAMLVRDHPQLELVLEEEVRQPCPA